MEICPFPLRSHPKIVKGGARKHRLTHVHTHADAYTHKMILPVNSW